MDYSNAFKSWSNNAIYFILKSNNFIGETYNVLTLNTSVVKIIKIIKKYKKNIKIKFVDSKIMNQLSYEVKSNKIKNKGLKIKGNIEVGIKNTLKLIKTF